MLGFLRKEKTLRTTSQGRRRADNGTRTRGLDLGKVALYQLSYVRDAHQRNEKKA